MDEEAHRPTPNDVPVVSVRDRVLTVVDERYLMVAILFAVNLLNYGDRFTVASVLTEVQHYYGVDDSQAGMLQTVFVCAYMLAAPLFGALADRLDRRHVLLFGLCVWILAVFLSSIIPRSHFYLFCTLRAIVGVGEASYATVAPTLIADSFDSAQRSKMLMLFYVAVPVGSGVGFVWGSRLSLWTGHWQWGVRLTPIFGLVCVVLLALLIRDPLRHGISLRAILNSPTAAHASTIKEDVRYLWENRTFFRTTIGQTASIFATGALSWWTPTVMERAWAIRHQSVVVPPDEKARLSLVFGLLTCGGGLCGVVIGSVLADRWRVVGLHRRLPADDRADAWVCALGALVAAPLLYFALLLAVSVEWLSFTFIFFAIALICFNWSVNMDILMSVVVQSRRATATAMQTLTAHLLGDASAPYFVGLLSDALRGDDVSPIAEFSSLRSALFASVFTLVVGGAAYLHASSSLVDDRLLSLDEGDDVETLHRNNPSRSGDVSE